MRARIRPSPRRPSRGEMLVRELIEKAKSDRRQTMAAAELVLGL